VETESTKSGSDEIVMTARLSKMVGRAQLKVWHEDTGTGRPYTMRMISGGALHGLWSETSSDGYTHIRMSQAVAEAMAEELAQLLAMVNELNRDDQFDDAMNLIDEEAAAAKGGAL
jgi:hypothetical protein